jgi:hypothetical protein
MKMMTDAELAELPRAEMLERIRRRVTEKLDAKAPPGPRRHPGRVDR